MTVKAKASITLVRVNDGVSISSITEYYAVSSSASNAPNSWSTDVPTMTVTNKYLWNYEKMTYSDGVEKETSKRVIGVYGNTGSAGKDGKGISSITNYYLVSASSSGVTTSTSGWSTSPGTTNTTNKYLWNYEKITYTDESTTSTIPHIIGTHGSPGKGVSTIVNRYLATNASSGVTASTSGWTTTVQSVSSSKKYLWNYETITYTDSSATTTTPCIIGSYGDTGDTGKGIASITEHYAISLSSVSAPSSWSTTVQTMTSTNKYLWNYETINYTDGSSKDTAKRVIGVYGDKGNDGEDGKDGADGNGVKSSAVTYQASTSGTTIPTGTWTSEIPSVAGGSYLWTRTIITYTNNSTTTSYSVGKMGTNGTNGDDGKGIKSTSITYQAGESQTSTPTGDWITSMPILTTSLPYLWTRTILTYTDNTTSTSYSVSSTLESFEIGGRNLLLKTQLFEMAEDENYTNGELMNNTDSETSDEIYNGCTARVLSNVTSSEDMARYYISEFDLGDVFTFSFWAKGDINAFKCFFFGDTGYVKNRVVASSVGWSGTYYGDGNISMGTPSSNWTRYWITWELEETGDTTIPKYVMIRTDDATSGDLYVCGCKLEKGNKATDWSPAPEDIDLEINDTKNDLEDSITEVDSKASTLFEQLNDMISMLVTGSDGESLMEQTDEGWTFNMSSIIERLDDTSNEVLDVSNNVDSLSGNLSNLMSTVNSLSAITSYVQIGQDESGKPYIELGANNNTFKVRITNTDIIFFDGTTIPASISNEALNIGKAVVDDSIKFGGHLLKIRSNGNLGILWEGE